MLTLHVFGVPDGGGVRGTGAYTLDIDALPQVVSVEAQALLPGVATAPGGPTASLVITFQGDRLDPTTAENPANYTVTSARHGQAITPRGPADTAASPPSTTPAPTSMSPAASTYPTAVRQTVTLLFAHPLPAGSYEIELAPAVQVRPLQRRTRPGCCPRRRPSPGTRSCPGERRGHGRRTTGRPRPGDGRRDLGDSGG